MTQASQESWCWGQAQDLGPVSVAAPRAYELIITSTHLHRVSQVSWIPLTSPLTHPLPPPLHSSPSREACTIWMTDSHAVAHCWSCRASQAWVLPRGPALPGIRYCPLAAKAWKHAFPPFPPHSLLTPASLLQNCHYGHGVICVRKQKHFLEKRCQDIHIIPHLKVREELKGGEKKQYQTLFLLSHLTRPGVPLPGHADCQDHAFWSQVNCGFTFCLV